MSSYPSPRGSNGAYYLLSLAALVVIATAWIGRDRFQGVVIGSPAPGFQAMTVDGDTATLDDFRGKVVLLNVWATWCPPCRYEMPSMQRLYEILAEDGLEIVAVSVDAPIGGTDERGRPGGNVWAFADSLALTFPILHDSRGEIMRSYRSGGVPESYLIGGDGTIYRKVSGATEWDHPRHVEFIRRLLDEEA